VIDRVDGGRGDGLEGWEGRRIGRSICSRSDSFSIMEVTVVRLGREESTDRPFSNLFQKITNRNPMRFHVMHQ